MKFNIAIIPPNNICNKAITISEDLYKKGGKFVLGKKTNFSHITLSRFNNSEDFDIETLSKQGFSFIVDKIGIFEFGEHGTNKKSLKEFELQ